MSSAPGNTPKPPIQTITRLLVCDHVTPSEEMKLEAARVEYEKLHGPTDLTKYYTSMRPMEEQAWLIDNHPQVWFKGLPPFLQHFFTKGLETRANRGDLDDVSPGLIKLWFEQKFRRGGDERSR